MAKKRKHLGFGFPDELAKVTGRLGYFNPASGGAEWKDFLLPNFHPASPDQAPQENLWRIIFFFALCLVLFFIIFLRLFHLQIVEGKANRELADGNRIQIKVIHAPRGVIFDRNGKILAANRPAFRLNTRLVTREQAMEWEVKNDPRALNLEVDNVRNYTTGEVFAHVIGYVGEISEEQLKKEDFKNYRPGDQIGKSGVEGQYEKVLRGADGGEIIEVDALGRRLRILRQKPAIPGQNIYLSIDASLQSRVYQLMEEALKNSGSCCGAAVALDPKNGQILALLSFPSFDPNLFTKIGDDSYITDIFSKPSAPVLNRVIAGTYPPGSTFKIISSLAALGSGKINADTTFEDTGIMYLGPYSFSNWYFNQFGKVDGLVDLKKAIMRSNDIYFYKASQIIGEKALAEWAKKLFLGDKLDIDIPGEEAGLVPDDAWKQKTYGQPWYPGDTLHMAIGQGFVLATPLQILGVTSYIAADGILYKPHLLLSDKSKILTSDLLPKEQIALIKEGMKLVPKTGGSAWPFFTFPFPTAGKTGTAEFGDKNKTHAWYTSFAPADDPKIAVTILIEAGGQGSSVSAPVAKEIYRWFFSPDKNRLKQDAYMPATDSGRTLGE